MNWRKSLARVGVYQWAIFTKKLFQKPRDKETYYHLSEGGYLTQTQADTLVRIKKAR